MKKLLLLFVGIALCALCSLNAQNKADEIPQDTTIRFPQLKFVATNYNFGKIRKGDKVTTSFFYKNTGTKPLMILQVQASCGCTLSNWTKEPIAPNAIGEITVTFDSAAKENMTGQQKKILLVISNALSKEIKLVLEGEIL